MLAKSVFLVIFIIFACFIPKTRACDEQMPFEGFGIFLGSISHLKDSEAGTEERVMEKVYHDLGIRYYKYSLDIRCNTVWGNLSHAKILCTCIDVCMHFYFPDISEHLTKSTFPQNQTSMKFPVQTSPKEIPSVPGSDCTTTSQTLLT